MFRKHPATVCRDAVCRGALALAAAAIAISADARPLALEDYYRLVNEKRLGVTGYSYGGFLTNWIIGHSTRFAAAVTGAGVSNWISDYGTSDIPRTKESEFFGPPWDVRAHELLRKQSPIEYAASVRTPTLFVHGESDMRVPIEEGEQMYVALRKLKVPARFVRYPDSYHGG
jgi:dipeptidyl aminopeptidase/acylaminoacyl peptidase